VIKIGQRARAKTNDSIRGLVVNVSERFTTIRTTTGCRSLLHRNICLWYQRQPGKESQ
jgi:hypothetical protein